MCVECAVASLFGADTTDQRLLLIDHSLSQVEKDLAKFLRGSKQQAGEEEAAAPAAATAAGGSGGAGGASGSGSSSKVDLQQSWNTFRWVGEHGD